MSEFTGNNVVPLQGAYHHQRQGVYGSLPHRKWDTRPDGHGRVEWLIEQQVQECCDVFPLDQAARMLASLNPRLTRWDVLELVSRSDAAYRAGDLPWDVREAEETHYAIYLTRLAARARAS